jgi:hypothetical protein
MTKIKFRKYFLSYLLCLIFLTNTNTVLAETSTYQNKGVQDTIKQYLCTPTDVSKDKNSKEVGATTGMGSTSEVVTGRNLNPVGNSNSQAQQQQSEIQYNSGANNNARYDLYDCINKVYRFAIAVGSVFAVFFIVIAGYLYMSSDGSSESVDKAKSIIASSITAMVILFSGYILLKEINPDLIAFQNIQPPSVKLQTLTVSNYEPIYDGNGNIVGLKSGTGETIKTLGRNNPQQVISAGCTFQLEKLPSEIAGIQTELFNMVIEICKTASPKGKIQVSSVSSGTHAKNSYHYKSCAVDFADGSGKFTENPAGIVAMQKAKELLGASRVNPGSDEDKVNHMHIELGSQCQNK